MESFEQKIKERNNLLKSQVESLTGRNELTEVIDTLLKAGVAEEDLVEKAKYIRREPDGKGGYKYIYSEPKENKIKTDKVDKKEDKDKNSANKSILNKIQSGRDGEYNKKDLVKEFGQEILDKLDSSGLIRKITIMGIEKYYVTKNGKEILKKSSESDLEKADKKQQKKIKKVMDEWKAGTLKTSSGEPVKDQKQAIAIAMSEAGMNVKKSTLSTVLKQNESDLEKGGVGSGRHKVKFDDYKNMFHSLKNKTHEETRKIRSDYFDEHYGKPSYNMKMFNLITDVSNSKNTHPGLTEKDKERSRKKMSKYEEKYKSEENDIEKSHLGEFSYSEKLGIKKTGKEIKEKFKANLQKEQSEVSELKAKLGVLKTKIGEEPTKKCDYWQIDAYEDKGIDIPLVYDYSYMTEKVAYDQVETQLLIGETPKVENTSKLRYEYNEIVRKYIDCQKEILQINTILNNYKDTDIYQLTISQATVLGF